MNIKDKIAIVTGGASGLGKAAGKAFIDKGGKLVIFDINDDKAAATLDEFGDAASYVNVNVMDEASVQNGVKFALEKHGAIHALVNAAGSGSAKRTVGRSGPFPLEEFQFIINLNLVGSFNVLRLVANEMQNNEPLTDDGERGAIVNVASVAGIDGQIGQAAYSASKAGVIGMTLPIARDLGKIGVRINTICPGIFLTELTALAPKEMLDGLASHAQFPGRLGDPAEFAELASHLLENSYMNGETIRLDAGMRMPPK